MAAVSISNHMWIVNCSRNTHIVNYSFEHVRVVKTHTKQLEHNFWIT